MEKEKWKPFRNVLSKSDRKKFEEMMFDIPRLYISACSYAVQPIRLYPILLSILFYYYDQLIKSNSQMDQMIIKVEGLHKVKKDSSSQLKLYDF
jgi:hypothetical protein